MNREIYYFVSVPPIRLLMSHFIMYLRPSVLSKWLESLLVNTAFAGVGDEW